MGTKNQPGNFDCYAAAGPDEPMFILLGRDRFAPLLVRLWAALRMLDGEDEAKVREARRTASAMQEECARRGKTPFCGELGRNHISSEGLHKQLRAFEDALVDMALRRLGSQRLAAIYLGVPLRTLVYRLTRRRAGEK